MSTDPTATVNPTEPPKKKKFTFKRPTRPVAAAPKDAPPSLSLSSPPPAQCGTGGDVEAVKTEKKVTKKVVKDAGTFTRDDDDDDGRVDGVQGKRTSFSRTDNDDDDLTSFFIPSEKVYKGMVADEKKKKEEKRKAKGKRKSEDNEGGGDGGGGGDGDGVDGESKRRNRKSSKIAAHSNVISLSSSDSDTDDARFRARGRSRREGTQERQSRPKSLTPPPQLYPTPSVAPPPPPTSVTTRTNSGPISMSLDSDSEDPDIEPIPPELAARAHALNSPPVTTSTSASTTTQPHQPAPGSDIITTILITSPIPNARPLLVRVRLSQKLKPSRLAWCRHQAAIGKVVDEGKIFLTFKGRKVFDSNTFWGVGVRERDVEGEEWWGAGAGVGTGVGVGGFGGGSAGMGSAGAGAKKGVQFVAVDEEWFRKMKEEEAREEEVKIPSHLGSGSSGKGRASEDVQVLGTNKAGSHGGDDGDDEDEVIRLILRIKGMEDFKIKVKSDTTIQKILSMLTSQRPQLLSGANAGKKVVLRFDGEDVDEDGVVADVDCEDMDVMDVFIR